MANPTSSSSSSSSRKSKRKLTPFLAKEMLYDYATKQLDEERYAAVKLILNDDRECQSILAAINAALAYTERLSETKVPQESVAALNDADNIVSIGRKYSSWQAWPDSFRWSVTAIGLSVVVAALVIFIPWNRFPIPNLKRADTVEVAKLDKPISSDNGDAPPADLSEPGAEPHGSGDGEGEIAGSGDSSGDEYGEEAGESIPDSEVYSGAPAKLPPPGNTISEVATKATTGPVLSGQVVPQNPPSAQNTKPAPAKPPAATPASQKVAAAAATATPKPEKQPSGFVYRAFMTLDNLDELAPEITDQIFALGGEKAGEVDIGWKRGKGRYYHFTLPAENEQKLMEQLQVYGPVRISKDPHPRVMPPEQVRFILWIESAN